jgi:hypothetical protein
MIMAHITVHPMEIRGTRYEVSVDPSGNFCTNVGSELVRSPTRTGLQDKLRELTAKASVKVRIPFVLMTAGRGITGAEVAQGYITGIHAGNGNMMVEWVTGWQAGQKTQWTPSYADVIFASATEAEVAQWRSLRRASSEAQNELGTFESERRFDIRAAAVKAVEEAARDARQG